MTLTRRTSALIVTTFLFFSAVTTIYNISRDDGDDNDINECDLTWNILNLFP